MGTDIHVFVEILEENGWKYHEMLQPFSWRSYGMFGFLANVRNYSRVPPLSDRRGIPDGFTIAPERYEDLHSHTWVHLDELINFDYDKVFEDRRCTKQIGPNSFDGAALAEEGEGEQVTFREFLGTQFFEEIALLQKLGMVRITTGFST